MFAIQMQSVCLCIHVARVGCCRLDWDNHPVPHLNGTIPGGSKRKDVNDGGGGKRRKKNGAGNAGSGGGMWDPTAALSNNEQQARQTRAKRFEAHLQASKQSNVGSNVRCLSALYCIASNKLVVEPTAFCRQDSASIYYYSISSGWCDC